MATAIQALCVIAYKGPEGVTSGIVARSLRTNPVVVRRLLKAMEAAGLVEIRPGKDGGVQLRRAPGQITLDQIYQAVEGETTVFALRPGGNPNCPVASRMQALLAPIFGATDSAVGKTLERITLGNLVKAIARPV